MAFTNKQASENIIKFATENRLIQRAWQKKEGAEEGKRMACLLGSIDPSVDNSAMCNGELMPLWLAILTPTLFDGIAADKVTEIGLRYGKLVGQWEVLSAANWDNVLYKFLIRVVDDAVDSASKVCDGKGYWPKVKEACALTIKALASKDPAELRNAAKYAADAANAANAAEYAANAAEYAAEYAAKYAADAAKYAAKYAAEYAADAAKYAAKYAADAAVYRMFTFLMDLIEEEIKNK
mgnify:CR=1 FL=1